MKVQFMKKLVPLALIASIAATNVGLTSVAVSAQETAIVQSVEGAPVVEDDNQATTAQAISISDENFSVIYTDQSSAQDNNVRVEWEKKSNGLTQRSKAGTSGYVFTLVRKAETHNWAGELTADDLKLFYFSTDNENTAQAPESNKIEGLSLAKNADFISSAGSEVIGLKLDLLVDATKIDKSKFTNTNVSQGGCVKYSAKTIGIKNVGLWCPVKDSDGTVEQKFIGTVSDVRFNNVPEKFDLSEGEITLVADENNIAQNSVYGVGTADGSALTVAENSDFEVTYVDNSHIKIKVKETSKLLKQEITTENTTLYKALVDTNETLGATTAAIAKNFYIVNTPTEPPVTIKQVTGGYSIPAGTTLNLAWDNEAQKIKLAKVNDKDSEQVLTDSLTGLYQFVKGADDKETKTDIASGTGFQTVAGVPKEEKDLTEAEVEEYNTAITTAINKYVDDNWATIDKEAVLANAEAMVADETKGDDTQRAKATALVNAKVAAQKAYVAGLTTDADINAFWKDAQGVLTTYHTNEDYADKDKLVFKNELVVEAEDGKTTRAAAVEAVWSAMLADTDEGGYASKIAAIDVTGNSDFITAAKEFAKVNAAEIFKDVEAYNTAVNKAKSDYLKSVGTQGGLDTSQFRWVVEEVSPDKNGYTVAAKNGKFANGTKFTKTDLTNTDNVTIGGTKANGNFNNVFVVKLVSKDYAPKTKKNAEAKGTAFASFNIYVTPAVPTAFNADDYTAKLAKNGVSTCTKGEATDEFAQVYNLTINQNKSINLNQIKPKDGKDKSMVYEVENNSTGFQVVKGVLKGLGSGVGTVVCYPKTNPSMKVKINVFAQATPTKLRANATTVTAYPGSTQQIYLGTSPETFDTTYVVSGGNDKIGATIEGNVLTITGAAGITKSDKVTLVVSATSNAAAIKKNSLNITVKGAEAPLNAKKFNLTTKKQNADGIIEVNIPEGSVKNLGIKMNPATADASIEWTLGTDLTEDGKNVNTAVIGVHDEVRVVTTAVTAAVAETTTTTVVSSEESSESSDSSSSEAEPNNSDGDEPETTTTTTAAAATTTATTTTAVTVQTEVVTDVPDIEVSGDVVRGGKEGTYYIKYNSIAKNEKNEIINTPIYKINVYKPGSTIVAGTDSAIVGGYLMSAENASTLTSKTIVGGTEYTFDIPHTAGIIEEIVWTTNKPSAVKIDTATDGKLKLTGLQTGKFNVTGTTKYTGQKQVFTVEVVPNDEAVTAAAAATFSYEYSTDGGKTWSATAPQEPKVGDKFYVRVVTSAEGAVGTIKFAPKDATKCAVSPAGLVTVKAAGEIQIDATITRKKADKKTSAGADITVTSAAITAAVKTPEFKKITVPAGAVKGAAKVKFTAAAKNVAKDATNIQWQYRKKNGEAYGEWTAISDATALTYAPTQLGLDAGTYKIRCTIGTVNSDEMDLIVYDSAKAVNKANVNYTWGTKDTDYDADVVAEAAKINTKINTVVAATKKDGSADEAKTKKNKTNVMKQSNAAYKTAISNLKGKDGVAYGTYYIPIFATDADGKYLTDGTAADIEWTSSNVNLATVQTLVNGSATTDGLQAGLINKAASAAYAIAEITANVGESNGYKGSVTLTGVLKNSGKKVKVTLNLTGTTGSTDEPVTPTPAEQTEVEFIQHFGTGVVNFGSAVGLPKIDGSSYPDGTEGYSENDEYVTNYELGLTTDKTSPTSDNSSNFGKVYNFQSDGKAASILSDATLTNGTTYYLVAKKTYKVFNGSSWGEEQTGYVVVGTKGFKAKYVPTTDVKLTNGQPVEVSLYEGKTFDGTGAHYTVVTAVGDKTAAMKDSMTGSSKSLNCQAASGSDTTKIAIVRHGSLPTQDTLKVGYIRNTDTNEIVAGPFYFSE